MSSIMIVDGGLAASLSWIAEYIDNLNGNEKNSLSQLVSELATPEEVSQELYFRLAEESHSLLNAPDDQFEGAFNLLLYILSQSSDFSGCIPVVLAHLNIQCTESKRVLILAVLSNLFNVIDPENKLRYDVLNKILDFAVANGTLTQVTPQLEQLPRWLNMWGIDNQTRAEFYTKIIDLVQQHVGPRQAFRLLVDGTKANQSPSLAQRLVSEALSNSFTFDFNEIAEIPAVKALNDARITAVVTGDYDAVKSSEDEQLLNKVRVVKFSQMASTSRELSYDDISSGTGLSNDIEIEALAIDAIKAGFVQGRMDQFKRVFLVEAAHIVGELSLDHWKVIDERLETWKQELKAHMEAVAQN